MKLNRRQLRRLIAESYGDANDPYNPDANPDLVQRDMSKMTRDQIPPHLRVDDDDRPRGGGSELKLVQNIVDDIEGSHGGLGIPEAATELVRQLRGLGIDAVQFLAEALLDAELDRRSAERG